MDNEFTLEEDDLYAVAVAINVARRLLRSPKITPPEIVGIGHALHALERLPSVTDGVNCEFGISYRAGSEGFSEMKYHTFRITEDEFELSVGGSVYDSSVGSDSYSTVDWSFDLYGEGRRRGGIASLESTIGEFLNLGAEIVVEDSSDIDFDSVTEVSNDAQPDLI